ncbi:MAG: glycoside hydrolase family 92 protein, partial [Acidobacteriota bacterium]
MRKLGVCVVLGSMFCAVACGAQRDGVSYVNPRIGTQRSAIGYGGTMPFVAAPFGMTDWTAQTRQNKISVTSYNYADPTISGFIGTHQPAIWMGDYGYVTLMPEVGELQVKPEDRQLLFKHGDEVSRPDYYAVNLDAQAAGVIRVEMTASERCSMMRYRFPAKGTARVLVEASRPGIEGFAAVDLKAHEITGYNPHRMDAHLGPFKLPHFKGYFVVQFREVPLEEKTYGMESAAADASRGAYAEFAPGETVEVRVG